MPLTKTQFERLDTLNKKRALSIQKRGPALTAEEEQWLLAAKQAQSTGGNLEDGSMDTGLATGRDINKPDTLTQEAPQTTVPGVVPMEEMTPSDQEQLSDQEVAERLAQLQAEVVKEAEAQGILEDIKKAIKAGHEVHVNSIRGLLFAFRPMEFMDMKVIKGGATDMENHKAVVEACILAGGDKLFKKARFGTYSVIYQEIMKISDTAVDLPFSVPIEKV